MNKKEKKSDELTKGKQNKMDQYMAYILFAISILYAISPVDIVPDIAPVIGWFDDVVIAITGSLNLIQKTLVKGNQSLVTIIKFIKFGILGIGIIIVLLILILGSMIINMF